MKKNELIELLNSIEGNPEVMLWNPYVDDFNPVQKVETDTLYKESVEHLFNWLKLELCQSKNSFDLTDEELFGLKEQAKTLHKTKEYQLPNEYVLEEEKERWYQKRTKKIITLVPKMVGKTSYGTHKYNDVEY